MSIIKRYQIVAEVEISLETLAPTKTPREQWTQDEEYDDCIRRVQDCVLKSNEAIETVFMADVAGVLLDDLGKAIDLRALKKKMLESVSDAVKIHAPDLAAWFFDDAERGGDALYTATETEHKVISLSLKQIS